MTIYQTLFNAVLHKNTELVIQCCEEDKTLDVTKDAGELFILAIESGSLDITQALIQYYEENHREEWEEKTLDGIIAVATDGVARSKTMNYILSKYLKFGADKATDCEDLLPDEMKILHTLQSADIAVRDGAEVTITGESMV